MKIAGEMGQLGLGVTAVGPTEIEMVTNGRGGSNQDAHDKLWGWSNVGVVFVASHFLA